MYSQLNPAPFIANVGPNPALADPTILTRNDALVQSMRNAAKSLGDQLTACQANPAGQGCTTLLAQQSTAQSLIQTTGTVATALEDLYGTGATHPGQWYVPLTSNASQQAINNRITTLGAQYQSLLNTNPISGSVTGAFAPGAQAAFQRLLLASGRDTIGAVDRTSIGDISVGATYQLANTYGDTTRTGQYRVAVNAAFRLGTGEPANRNRLFDLPTGYGQPGVIVGGATDIRFTRRVTLSAIGSYTAQLGTITVARVPGAGNAIYPLGRARDVFRGQRHATWSYPAHPTRRILRADRAVFAAFTPRRTIHCSSRAADQTTVPPTPLSAQRRHAQQIGLDSLFDGRRTESRARRNSVRGVVQPPRDARRERRPAPKDLSRSDRAPSLSADRRAVSGIDSRLSRQAPVRRASRRAAAASSSSRACARLTSLSGSPPSMRAISATRVVAARARRRRRSSRRRARPC